MNMELAEMLRLRKQIDPDAPDSIVLPPETTAALAYSFPLRQNFMAQLVLPRDFTVLEGQRLSAFLLALTDQSSEVKSTAAEQITAPDR